MANKGMATSVPYGSEVYELTGVEYCELEDKLEAIDGYNDRDKAAIYEWITYDYLMSQGYFPAKPQVEKPQLQTDDERENEPPKPLVITGASREPVWTQSKILAERERLLAKREALLKKEIQLSKKENNYTAKVPTNQKVGTFVTSDGEPYSGADYLIVFMTLVFLIGLVYFLLK